MQEPQRSALLTLSLVPGLGPTLTRRCLELFGTARCALNASPAELAQVQGIGTRRSSDIRREIDALANGKALAKELALIDEHNVTLIAEDDPNYPALLRHIPDPPPMLYARGEVRETDAVALAVVGSRRCTAYGREQADRLSALCAQAGLCIVSGGARGIDAAAHHAALRAQGRTIAVLGSGLANPYPAEHTGLFDTIADGRGAVLSELNMTAKPLAQHFPRRNRIVSGLALGVLVVEAAVRSGAMITARLAVEEHSREALALPGRVDSPTSAGCHKMLREGWAALVTNATDILDALGETGHLLRAGLDRNAPEQPDAADPTTDITARNLTDPQRRLLDALDQPRSLDQLADSTGLTIPKVQADLTMLQIRSLITHQSGQYHRRTR